MPAPFTRADAIREYLTGAASDGGAQSDPSMSLGNFRSSTEAASLGITIISALGSVTIQYAGGGNLVGTGTLTASDSATLTWTPPGSSTAGVPVTFSGTNNVEIVEGPTPGAYLRINGSTPFTPGASSIGLNFLIGNVFGMNDVSSGDASIGASEYRASIVVNESVASVTSFQRYIGLLGTPQTSDGGHLAASGAGTLVTSGSLADWPAAGWCQIRTSSNSLRELVYYTSRSNTILTVPAAGRGLLGSSAGAGSGTDSINPVPGVAIAIDTAGVQAGSSSIQLVGNINTAPTSVSWNTGITAGTGLQIGTLLATQQVGLWLWRQTPPGAIASPRQEVQLEDSFVTV